MHLGRWVMVLALGLCLGLTPAQAQIDPVKRELIEVGYNAAIEGHPPLSVYAFFYRNQPDFLEHTNLTLRLAIAPTYLDSEMGFSGLLGPNTDLGVGIAGGGFGDSYYEIRQGKYLREESFDGYGGQLNLSLYHLFNPGYQIPLNGVLRGSAHYATYAATSDTAANFQVPDAQEFLAVRTGLRWGGREPTLFPSLAMELSVWYEGQFRTEAETYGFGDRRMQPHSHLFWAEAYLAYELPKWKHKFSINLTGGTSIDADRFSAYRLGGVLPMAAEFPLSLPGYYYQELSAKEFFLANGNYFVPVSHNGRWNLGATAATAFVSYLPGLEQPGHWNSGVGGGLFYFSKAWRVMVSYGYGFDAIRSDGRGANSIGFLMQLDLAPAKEAFFKPEPPGLWRGFQRFLGVLGD